MIARKKPIWIRVNDGIGNCSFPDKLKSADVSSLLKAEAITSKKSYRPVSVLPTVSKVFERIMDRQMIKYITPFLSVLLCGFRKSFDTQHALIRMLEKWRVSLDNGENVGAILMDLSKAFDCSMTTYQQSYMLMVLAVNPCPLFTAFWGTGSKG